MDRRRGGGGIHILALPRIAALVRLRRGPGATRPAARPAVVLAALAATWAPAACGEPRDGVDEDTYVRVMAQLTWARARYANTVEGDSARAAALDDFGVTGRELEDFAERYGGDPQRMHRLWVAIRREVDVLDGVPSPESQAGEAEHGPEEAGRGGR